MTILSIIQKTIGNMNIISCITSSVFIILLGFYCRKKEIFSKTFAKTLSKVVLSVALPALAFNSFMQDIDSETLHQGINVLIWGFLIYIILIFLTKPLYSRYTGDKQDTLRVLTIFGSTTFFGIPIVGALFGAQGVMYSSIFNIGYRVFLYSYAYIKMSGLKMESKNIKTMFLNPIVIATFLGLFLWLTQDFMPHVTVAGHAYAFFRIDQTAIWLFKPLTYLASICSPLAWLSIGATLGEISFKEAASDKLSWKYSVNKVILVPVINLILLTILTVTHILPVSFVALATVIIMMATPTATVAAAYAISFDKEALFTSNASLLSTILGVVMTPIWIMILELINQLHIF